MPLLFFILGLVIGSFLNVLIDRLPKNESMLGRSHCDNCKKTLSWKDLIPVISFVYLHGKCRYCHTPLSYQYPLIELVTGTMFALTYLYLNNPISNIQYQISNDPIFYLLFSIYYFFIVSVMIVVFFADLKYGIIPDKIIFPAIVVVLIYLAVSTFYIPSSGVLSSILNHLSSALGSFFFFLFIYLITKGRGMGFGDIKLSFLIGLILSFPTVVLALYIAFLTGGSTGIILILWRKKSLTSKVPFGPFLVIGCLISLFLGDLIISKVMGLLS